MHHDLSDLRGNERPALSDGSEQTINILTTQTARALQARPITCSRHQHSGSRAAWWSMPPDSLKYGRSVSLSLGNVVDPQPWLDVGHAMRLILPLRVAEHHISFAHHCDRTSARIRNKNRCDPFALALLVSVGNVSVSVKYLRVSAIEDPATPANHV
jgi:hypothetical protein